MIKFIKDAYQKWKWKREGSLYLAYPGFNCGCCGSWTEGEFKIPEYLSAGRWWDTIDICDKCIQAGIDRAEEKSNVA